MKKRLTTLIFILGIFYNALAETFIVTSNADSGPGTLRAAIIKAAANGTSERDFITFNITDLSPSGRTLVVRDTLPALSAHLVIDASTQPGQKFGVSDAKIKIVPYAPGIPRCFILMDIDDIEIYGVFITGFKSSNTLYYNDCAIYLTGAVTNVKIGKPGMGNYFDNNTSCIYNSNEWHYWRTNIRVNNIEIKSNVFGLSEDGNSVSSHQRPLVLKSASNITIGGWNADEGNFFVGSQAIQIGSDSAKNNGYTYFLNNKCGTSYDQKTPLKYGGLIISNATTNGGDDVVIIQNNIFNSPSYVGSNWCNGMASVYKINGGISIKGNKIGTLIKNSFTCQSAGISIGDCENGIIGGDSEEEQNIISYNSTVGIYLYNNRYFKIVKNSIYCNGEGITANSSKVTIPFIKISNENGINFMSGTTVPNAKVEVFETLECTGCKNGKTYLGETTADGNGNWSFTGNYTGAISARATTPEGATGEFAKPFFNEAKVSYKFPTCQENNGYIRGMEFISGTKYYWTRGTGSGVDTIFNSDVENAKPGLYTFTVEQGKLCKKDFIVWLGDASPKINAQLVAISHPSCGRSNGSITNIYTSGSVNKLYWIDEARNIISKERELTAASPGKYKLIALDTTYGCGDSTQYFTLTNQSGPSLITSRVQITNTTCGLDNGSIAGITPENVTGAASIRWTDESNKIIGTSLNLSNVPAGNYRLKFKDGSSCDTIITPYYSIKSTGAIAIDTTNMKVTVSECAYASGTIKDITATGATAYQWQNALGEKVSQQLDPGFLYPGKYILTATNAYGCQKKTDSIHIPTATYFPFSASSPIRIDGRAGQCNINNGFVNISNFPNPEKYTFRWTDSSRNEATISTELNLQGFYEGRFYLYVKDAKGCEQKAVTAILRAVPVPKIDESRVQITSDLCNQLIGKIENLPLTNGTGQPPFIFNWIDEQSNILSNQQTLTNKGAGQYQLIVQDRLGCKDSSSWYAITNETKTYNTPVYAEQTIPRNTKTTLKVSNPQTGTYQLFDAPNSTLPILENTTGNFETDTLKSDGTFYIKVKTGLCESQLAAIHIKVVDDTKVYVPTAFSPNKDGKNDVLKPLVIGLFYLDEFAIYDRWGNAIFRSYNLNNGWNGSNGRQEAPIGTYIWTLKGKDLKGNLINLKGTTTLLR